MTNYVDKLQSEHARFEKLLTLLEAQIGLFHRAEQPDYDMMLDIFYYMTHFPDRFHHPKEDLAFARLAERAPAIGSKVKELARLHRVIAQSGARFVDKLDATLAGAMLTRESVEIPALEYVALYRDHMKLEEHELFPLAREKLRDEDWAEFDAAMDSGEDPLFGRKPDERYRAIRDGIARNVNHGQGGTAAKPD